MGRIKTEQQKIADKQNIEFYKTNIENTKRDLAAAKRQMMRQIRDIERAKKILGKLRRKK